MTAVAAQHTPRTREAAPRRLDVDVLDDGQLAERHLTGDPQAFGALVDRYQTRLLNFIHCAIGDPARAEDLVQEVFIRAFRHMRRFDRTKRFSIWIYTIASTLAKTELRGRWWSPVDQRWPLQIVDVPADSDDLFSRAAVAETVAQGVRRLPESLRDVFVLRELEGMSDQEIAEITGCDVGTVRTRLSRARSSFARAVEPLVT